MNVFKLPAVVMVTRNSSKIIVLTFLLIVVLTIPLNSHFQRTCVKNCHFVFFLLSLLSSFLKHCLLLLWRPFDP